MNKRADAAFLSTSSILLFIYTILETAFSLAFSQPAYYSGLQNGPGGRNLQQQKRNVTRMISLILAEKIFSLFLIMFMGYAVVHWGLLHAEDSKTLSLISLYLISPCVIISAFQVQYTPDVLHGLLLALAAAVLLHVGIIVVVNLLGHTLHLDAVEKASMIYSNAGNLIIPIVTAVLGKEWVIYSSAFLSVQLFLLWSHAKSMLCGEKSFALKKVLTNINMIAILAGAALFLLHIQLPAVIEDSLDMVGSAIGPISMIILGMLMAGMNFKKILGYRRLWLVTALRLVGIPLAAVALLKLSGLAHLVPDGQTILLVSLLATCTPSASTITQMAQIYGKDADYASAINVVTTLLCIFTMPLMVALCPAIVPALLSKRPRAPKSTGTFFVSAVRRFIRSGSGSVPGPSTPAPPGCPSPEACGAFRRSSSAPADRLRRHPGRAFPCRGPCPASRPRCTGSVPRRCLPEQPARPGSSAHNPPRWPGTPHATFQKRRETRRTVQ